MKKKIISDLKLMFLPSEENNYRPEFLVSKILFYFIIASILLKLVAIPFFVYFPENVLFADITKTSLVRLVNQERQSLGINLLKEDPKLNTAALLKAEDMIRKGYFSHQSPTGASPWSWFKQAGYNYQYAGENLAIGFIESEEVHNGWVNSPSHNINLVNPNYEEIGIAVVKGNFQGMNTTIVVQLFGTSLPESAVVPVSSITSKPKPVETNLITEEEVIMGETTFTEVEDIVFTQGGRLKENFIFNLFTFASLDYNNLIEVATYALLALVLISSIISILAKFSVQDKNLIFRSILLIILLGVSVVFDKEAIIRIIPHDFWIY